jgi:hypothetical protein
MFQRKWILDSQRLESTYLSTSEKAHPQETPRCKAICMKGEAEALTFYELQQKLKVMIVTK